MLFIFGFGFFFYFFFFFFFVFQYSNHILLYLNAYRGEMTIFSNDIFFCFFFFLGGGGRGGGGSLFTFWIFFFFIYCFFFPLLHFICFSFFTAHRRSPFYARDMTRHKLSLWSSNNIISLVQYCIANCQSCAIM